MTGIRITPFGMAPKISNLVVDGDLDLGGNKLRTNAIDESTEGHGVTVDGRLTCEGVTALAHVVTPSDVNVLYSNPTSYPLPGHSINAEKDLFSLTIPPGYTDGGVSVTVNPSITVSTTHSQGQQVSGYVSIYVNGALNCTLSHSAWLEGVDGGSSSTETKTSTLLGISSGDVILVRGYFSSAKYWYAGGSLTKFEIKGNSGAFVGSGAPIWPTVEGA